MPFLLLMPSYNQARFITEAVDSCLAQDDPDWELWILDNSSDETPEVMKRYTDPRIHFIHEPRRMDPGTCLNILLEKAQGEHFSYVHTDNRLLPSFVATHRKALSQHPLAVAVCDYWEMDESGKRLKIRRRPDPFPLNRLFSVDSIGVPFAATMEVAKRLGGFTADDLADDVLFVLRADTLGPRIHIREPQMEYRVHATSRFLTGGTLRVFRAIHKSVLVAYGERAAHLPDPFAGGLDRARAHVAKASRMALSRARAVAPGTGPLWIRGTGPAAFWLGWALAELGRPVAGFIGEGVPTLLGVPVAAHAPEGAQVVDPRIRGAAGVRQAVRWLVQGLPPLDHPLKRLPGDVMAGFLVPFQLQTPGARAVRIQGEGALAAYLAYAAEHLGGLQVEGFIARRSPWPGLPVVEAGDGPVWTVA
ncbi:MAG TPA: glycosyltransferase [Holophagaceae bacterium]|nr:glycosyltransferase [Holophagaceae bacterium]